ncbi:concanavalin A-like lectin/glucanase domain-containing protein, partial [Neohortaea acidophila]
RYVNETVAVQNGYTKTTNEGTAVIGVDTTNLWPTGGPGRPSVRLISDNTYTHGLFILDVLHMPFGCGTWPAYWLLGPNWPYNGEIDIIEGVNTIGWDSVTLHTSSGCTISGSDQTGIFQTNDCSGGCGSILNDSITPNNYGSSFNDNNGGVYATEWTSNYIKTWFFPRNAIPSSITSGSPDPNGDFGKPGVNSQAPCPFDQHFNNMSIIINIDFCGAWAGQVYSQYTNCPQNASAPNSLDSCVDFVGLNPKNFTDAYWEIDSIKVYQ